MMPGYRNTLAAAALPRPLAPVPDAAGPLLATVQQLWLELRTAPPAEWPFLERDIRAYADRYRACAPEDLTLC